MIFNDELNSMTVLVCARFAEGAFGHYPRETLEL